MTSPEELLSDALHDRVDRREVPTTPMSEVVSTARGIQRRRRVRTAGVTAAVVAVLATPFVISAMHPADQTRGPVDTPSSPPAPHVRLADVALGQPPAIPWIDGSDYVAADGTRTTLPLGQVSNATPYRGGFLAVTNGPDLGPRVVLLGPDLQQVWDRCGQGSFAVNRDGSQTAYAAGDCRSTDTTLHLGPTDGNGDERTQRLPLEQTIPVGIVGDTVVTTALDGTPTHVTDLESAPEPVAGLAYATSVDEPLGLVSGQRDGQERTGIVVDLSSGATRWSAPGWYLSQFSPDGSMVLGVGTGRGGGVGVFDARTGDLLHTFGMPAGFEAQQTAWEDDEHLLSVTTQGSTQAILRLTLDGAIERATEAAPYVADSFEVSYAFAPRP